MDGNEINQGANAGAQSNGVADATQTTKQTPDGEPLINKQEVVELRKEVRRLESLVKDAVAARTSAPKEVQSTQQSNGHNADALAVEFATLKRELSLKDAYAEHGVKPGPLRDLLERAIQVDKPDNVADYVKRYVTAFAPTNGQPPAPQQAPVGRSDTGAPGSMDNGNLPNDPKLIPAQVMASLSAKERREVMDRYFKTAGMNSNPFRR